MESLSNETGYTNTKTACTETYVPPVQKRKNENIQQRKIIQHLCTFSTQLKFEAMNPNEKKMIYSENSVFLNYFDVYFAGKDMLILS